MKHQPWTRDDLVVGLAEYERELVAAGRTPGTIATYVGDVRRFIDWLGGPPLPGNGRPRGAATGQRWRRAKTPLVPPISVPDALRILVAESRAIGEDVQAPIAWPRDRWIRHFPFMADDIREFPDRLGRADVRSIARHAADSDHQAVTAFVATMAWGFGSVGYGPTRAQDMLSQTQDAPGHLRAVADAIRNDGAVAGYVKLSSECRIKGLGPAFGTKYIAFCQPEGQVPTALIHDELVSTWLALHGRADLVTATWAPRVYDAYLQQIASWSATLKELPERLEFLIFRSMSNERGNQWSG